MTTDQIRRTLQSAPFVPFNVRMADGRIFPIRHPDFLNFGPGGRTAVVFHEDGSASIVDVLLMTEIELLTTPGGAG